jgi:hypothetical protein
MAKKVRLTQEEEVIRLLTREGFREVSPEDLKTEPFKSIAKKPDCFARQAIVRRSLPAI